MSISQNFFCFLTHYNCHKYIIPDIANILVEIALCANSTRTYQPSNRQAAYMVLKGAAWKRSSEEVSGANREETTRRRSSVKEGAVKRAGSEDQRIDCIVHTNNRPENFTLDGSALNESYLSWRNRWTCSTRRLLCPARLGWLSFLSFRQARDSTLSTTWTI